MSHSAICKSVELCFSLLYFFFFNKPSDPSSLNMSTISEIKSCPRHFSSPFQVLLVANMFAPPESLTRKCTVNIAWLNEDGSSSVSKVSGAKGKELDCVLRHVKTMKLSDSTSLRKTLSSRPRSLALAGLPTAPAFSKRASAPRTTWVLRWDHVEVVTLHRSTPSGPRLSPLQSITWLVIAVWRQMQSLVSLYGTPW